MSSSSPQPAVPSTNSISAFLAKTADRISSWLLPVKSPIKQIGVHLVGLHGYSGDINRQVVAHHYCSHVGEEMHQCVIYDSDQPGAKLIGIEYLINEKLFNSLDLEERKLWHSHHYEVKSGLLAAPELPVAAETALVSKIATMYGKTIHTWAYDKDELPIGAPNLMMALTNDKQVDQRRLQEYERGLKNTWKDRSKARRDVEVKPKLEGADAWEMSGKAKIWVTTEIGTL
jgi:hypothetical protein